MDMSALKKKELGLPVGVWAIIVALLVLFLYRHYSAKGGQGTSSTGAAVDNTAGGGAGFPDIPTPPGADPSTYGFGGSGGVSAPATDPLAAYDPTGGFTTDPNAVDNSTPFDPFAQGPSTGIDWGNAPTSPTFPSPGDTTAPIGVGSPVEPGGMFWTGRGNNGPATLEWGGKTFTSQAQFKAWLSQHGVTHAGFALKHPAANKILRSLPAGSPSVSVSAQRSSRSSGTKKRVDTSPAKKRVGTRLLSRAPVKTATTQAKAAVVTRAVIRDVPSHTVVSSAPARSAPRPAAPPPPAPRALAVHPAPPPAPSKRGRTRAF